MPGECSGGRRLSAVGSLYEELSNCSGLDDVLAGNVVEDEGDTVLVAFVHH